MRIPILAIFALAVAAAPEGASDLVAQPLRAGSVTAREVAPAAPPARTLRPAGGRSVPALAGAGLLGGAVGLVAGVYAGAVLADDGEDDLDVLGGALIGGAIGEALLLPLGVHLADGRRGSYTTSALASLGLAGIGLLALEAVHYDAPGAPIVLVAVPLAQVAGSIAIERATDRRGS